MKNKIKTLKYFLLGISLAVASILQAQVSVNINIGTAPDWGPSGYSNVRYYYLPDVEAYYDINNAMFIYYTGGAWIHRTYLPGRYRNYNLYNGYKVVMTDYHGNEPHHFHKQYKVKYAKGYKGSPQQNIGSKKNNNVSGSHKNYGKNSNNKSRYTNQGGKNKGGKGKGGRH